MTPDRADVERAQRAVVEALRRPLSRQEQRRVDRAAAVAHELLRQRDRRQRRLPR